MSTTNGLAEGYSPFEVGTGRVDVAAAVDRHVRGTGSLFFGNFDWPHEADDAAVTKDLVLTNDGTEDVTLDLALTGTSSAFTLGASTVTVPAGGKQTVTVTGDPTAVDLGRHVGYVVGTDAATGDPVTRTSLGLLKEDERYDLDVTLVDRNGEPASGWVAVNIAGDPMGAWGEYVDGARTLRMPPGNYSLTAFLDVDGDGGRPVRPRRARRPGDRAGPRRRGRARRAGHPPARDHRTPAHGGPPAQGRPEHHRRQRPGVPQRVRRTAGRRRHLRLADRGHDLGLVHADDPLAQGRADARPRYAGRRRRVRHPRAAGQRARHRDRDRDDPLRRQRLAADYAGLDAQGKVVVVHRSDEVAPAGARRGSRGRGRGRTDRGQRRHRRAQRVRRRRDDPGRDRPPRRGGDPRRDGEERHEAGPVAAEAHPLRLRPDPRVPGPGAGPSAGLRAAEDRPRPDRRPLLRRPARRRRRLPVRRHPEPVARLRRAGAPPGHPGGVGDAGPEVGRVARPEHHGCAPVADGLRGQHASPRARPPASTGSVRRCVPASATPSASTTPGGGTT